METLRLVKVSREKEEYAVKGWKIMIIDHLLYVNKLDMVGKFRSDFKRCITGRAAVRSVGAVVLHMCPQTSPRCVHSRTQCTAEAQYTYGHVQRTENVQHNLL